MLSVQAAVRAAIASIGQGLYGVACSGGADSMALADAAIEVAGAPNVVVLTIDHGLNPNSAEIAAGVAAWARGRGAAAVVRRVEVRRRASIEAAARDARYAAFAELAEQLGLSAILTGHTARDQAETVLLRLLRGSGPAGLAGIPFHRPLRGGRSTTSGRRSEPSEERTSSGRKADASGRHPDDLFEGVVIVRPLLGIDREAIDAYVAERALSTWVDPMNADRSIARVRVREELLPLLRRENPQLDAALVRLAGSASEWLEVIDAIARPFAHFPIDCTALAKQPAAIRKRAVALALETAGASYEGVHLDAIDHLLVQPARGEKALDLPDGRFVRRYDVATFEPTVSGHRTAGAPNGLSIPEGCDARIWHAGDRMRPARLRGKSRKLSDLYVDGKVPRTSRSAARVIVRRSDAAIVWAEYVGIAHESVISDEERQKLLRNTG